ncbi:hypothetical protein E4U53_000160 [Claviceps sorghi]|nr:hypothetical protein E4U53_000160 [Claviceps sorghi]
MALPTCRLAASTKQISPSGRRTKPFSRKPIFAPPGLWQYVGRYGLGAPVLPRRLGRLGRRLVFIPRYVSKNLHDAISSCSVFPARFFDLVVFCEFVSQLSSDPQILRSSGPQVLRSSGPHRSSPEACFGSLAHAALQRLQLGSVTDLVTGDRFDDKANCLDDALLT